MAYVSAQRAPGFGSRFPSLRAPPLGHHFLQYLTQETKELVQEVSFITRLASTSAAMVSAIGDLSALARTLSVVAPFACRPKPLNLGVPSRLMMSLVSRQSGVPYARRLWGSLIRNLFPRSHQTQIAQVLNGILGECPQCQRRVEGFLDETPAYRRGVGSCALLATKRGNLPPPQPGSNVYPDLSLRLHCAAAPYAQGNPAANLLSCHLDLDICAAPGIHRSSTPTPSLTKPTPPAPPTTPTTRSGTWPAAPQESSHQAPGPLGQLDLFHTRPCHRRHWLSHRQDCSSGPPSQPKSKPTSLRVLAAYALKLFRQRGCLAPSSADKGSKSPSLVSTPSTLGSTPEATSAKLAPLPPPPPLPTASLPRRPPSRHLPVLS